MMASVCEKQHTPTTSNVERRVNQVCSEVQLNFVPLWGPRLQELWILLIQICLFCNHLHTPKLDFFFFLPPLRSEHFLIGERGHCRNLWLGGAKMGTVSFSGKRSWDHGIAALDLNPSAANYSLYCWTDYWFSLYFPLVIHIICITYYYVSQIQMLMIQYT